MFKSKTASTRRRLVYGVTKLLTPIMYTELQAIHVYTHRMPRPFTEQLKKQFGNKPLVGCEIGFGQGLNAQSLLDNLNIKQLYCIDPSIGKEYQDGSRDVKAFINKPSLYPKLKQDPRVIFIEKPSSEAVTKLPDKLDFVYIDGLHNYDGCLTDLQNYYALMNEGGLLGGHDFTKFLESDVVKAVFDFAVAEGLAPSVAMPDYWFKIPMNKYLISYQYSTPNMYSMEEEIKGE
jgi:hypothetical protein